MGINNEKPNCPRCGSVKVYRDGKKISGRGDEITTLQRFRCNDCGKKFVFGSYEDGQIEHFGVKLRSNNSLRISRESFSEPDDKISYAQRKNLEFKIAEGLEIIPNEVYRDELHYTDEFVKEHMDDCGENFDINMAYFNSLNPADFNRYLQNFVKESHLLKIENLAEVDNVEGIYVLVLGDYSQAYIGQSTNIKRRILRHWSSKKEFDRRIFGTIQNSILPIDSFGALDTTEIYYRKASYWNIHDLEEKLVRQFDQKYLLNRVAGGINDVSDMSYRNIMLALSARHRDQDSLSSVDKI